MQNTILFGIPRKKQEALYTDVWHNFCNFSITGEIALLYFELLDFIFVSIKGYFMNWRRQSRKILLLPSLSFWQSLVLCCFTESALQYCTGLVTEPGRVFQQTFWPRKYLDCFKIKICFGTLRFPPCQQWGEVFVVKEHKVEEHWLWDLLSGLQLMFEQLSAGS